MDPATGSGRRLQALSNDHRAAACSNQGVDDILETARKQKVACESKQWVIKLGSRSFKIRNGFSNIIDWLQKFKEVGDIAVNFDPVHAALPWAAFRFLLQAATASRDSMEAIVTVLELVSRIIQHGRVFEKLHVLASEDTHDEQDVLDGLKKTVVDLYVAVLTSLDYCCTRLDQNTGHRSLSAILKPQEAENIREQLTKRWNIVEDNARSLQGLRIVKISADIKGSLPDVLRMLKDLKDVSKVLVKMKENERRRILDNISTTQFGSQHKSVHDRRTKGTGEWVLLTPEFRQWETDECCPITLLYGSPGSGKTFLISRVIDRIKERLGGRESNCGLAYFYCDRNDINRRQPTIILSSLVRQLASPIGRVDEVHQCIQELDKKLRSECLQMDLQLCQDTIVELAASYQRSSIVLDALDECDEESRSQLMGCISEILLRCRNLKVFVSSRMEYDIRQYFKSQPTITIRATDNQNDIESFIRERLGSDAQWNSLDRELREEAQSTLFAKSDGMFQWANLQIQELLRIKHLSNKAIRECLRTLPATLDETYGRIWEKINKQNPSDRKIGRRAIKWALSINRAWDTYGWVFPQALRIDDETESLYDIDETPPIPAIEGACYNLLVYDMKTEKWQFCHLSAAEYLESAAMSELQPHRDAAIACLKYLLDGLGSQPPPYWSLQYNFPSYASRHWHYHVKRHHDSSATKHPQLEHRIERFLGSATQSARMYYVWADEFAPDNEDDLQPSSSPLFGVVKFGLCRVLKDWYDLDPSIDLDVRNKNGYSLLGLAARECHFDLCQFLVAKGVNIEAGTPSPLHLVCGIPPSKLGLPLNTSPNMGLAEPKETHKTVKQIAVLLIDNGADVNSRDRDGRTPLDMALSTSKEDVISMLVKHNAEIGNLTDGLLSTVRLVNRDWMRYCLDSGATIDESDREIWNQIIFFIISNKTISIKMLLEAGIDINYTPRNGHTLLNMAACFGNLDLMSLLIKAGANANPKGAKEGPIYQAAASSCIGDSKSIKKLFHSVAANILREGVSPLVGACHAKDALRRSKLLLDLGADPNHIRHFESPLVSAALSQEEALLQLFLEAGADPNSKDGFENALLLASRYPTNRALQRLLDVGADPTLTFTQGPGSALAFAAFIGNIEACSFLLNSELGVDVNAKLHGWFENVLFAAMSRDIWDSNETKWLHALFNDGLDLCCTPKGYMFSGLWDYKLGESGSKIIALLFEAGANVIIPIYKTLPPSLPAINVGAREYLISSARATSDFSRHWLSVVWDIGSSPRPHLPLSTALRRYKLPFSVPPSASILIKLTSTSAPPDVEYAGIFIFSNASTRLIFDKNKSRFEHFGKFHTTAQISIFEDAKKSCEKFLPFTSSIKPLPNQIIRLTVFIGFILYIMYALLRSE
ncbi:unnamed protein product [Clonostachys rhizophaga]|uniref:Nephrocystin 3-like N-terminal domain-containing protein n=1 Tax=Clonostachys rhizophaga TaxID=160324 RepID=A0A9N9YWU4_9HYPO|nr:unnamed protein product [Clonostachys rhizophaga]